ncbi:hypothetical protein BAS06_12075 [Elizabethkingia miricola]|uniref:hypothetical protein n=1 Tax=Elizabethkingia miricola TaxID=172045 RepID=UPI00099971F2|nr:hypothetical protein [Elizabethkingia miricola]OPB87922.1 hypothetical protein BAS06_12075 [Elizabethkingia miricola]
MTAKKTLKFGEVEVFTTNIQSKIQAERIVKILESCFPKLKINFDLFETELSYPCGHTILRVEDNEINSENIISIIKKSGFMCDILEDKVCK